MLVKRIQSTWRAPETSLRIVEAQYFENNLPRLKHPWNLKFSVVRIASGHPHIDDFVFANCRVVHPLMMMIWLNYYLLMHGARWAVKWYDSEGEVRSSLMRHNTMIWLDFVGNLQWHNLIDFPPSCLESRCSAYVELLHMSILKGMAFNKLEQMLFRQLTIDFSTNLLKRHLPHVNWTSS